MPAHHSEVREPLSSGPLRIRVTPSQMHRLQAGAAAEGIPFADFVRGLLDRNLRIHEELVNLRRIILDQGGQNNEAPTPTPGDAAHVAAIETLLLLRQLVRPENIRATHTDMVRLHLSPFQAIKP